MQDRHSFLTAAIATVLFLIALRTFLSSVYFLNLETLELNTSALYALLLLAPMLLVLSPIAQRARTVLVLAGVVLGAGAFVGGLAPTAGRAIALAGMASAAYLVLIPVQLHLGRGAPVAVGMAAALAFDAARLVAGASVEPVHGTLHHVFLLLLGVALIVLVLLPRGAASHHKAPAQTGTALLAGAGFGAWLFLQAVVWASPHHVARWNVAPVPLIAAAILLGLVLGAGLILRYAPRPPPARALVAMQVLPLLLLVDHTLLHSPLLPLTLLLAQIVLVVDLALLLRVLSRAPLPRAALGMSIGMLLLLVLTFTSVFAFTFAYVPLRSAWEGNEAIILLVAVATLLSAAAVIARRSAKPAATAFPKTGRERRIVSALLVLPLLVGVVGITSPSATPVPPDGDDVRVLSFNVHQGFNNNGVLDPGIFVRLVRDIGPDIVSIQESDTTRITSGNMDIVQILAETLGYHAYHGQPTRAQSFGVAILSRHSIIETALHRLPSAADNRYLVGARIDVRGTDIWFYAVHMGLGHEDRAAQIEDILAHAQNTTAPRILAGDFNSCPDGLCPGYDGPPDTVYAQVTARYQDTWTAAGNDAADPAGHTYSATSPHQRIDHIFASNDFTVVDARVDRSAAAIAASDHLPVIARLRVGT